MDGIANYFPAINALERRIFFGFFAYIQFQHFSWADTPDLRKSAYCPWTHPPITDSLASVPIVIVLRNDHWFAWLILYRKPRASLSRQPTHTDKKYCATELR